MNKSEKTTKLDIFKTSSKKESKREDILNPLSNKIKVLSEQLSNMSPIIWEEVGLIAHCLFVEIEDLRQTAAIMNKLYKNKK